jgi:uncharacterized membrane protein YfcA
MSAGDTALLATLFLAVGALYGSVGHAGASGYLAVMALVGMAPDSMRSIALSVNVAVAAIAFASYATAGHFSWRFFGPLALASVPAAFLGGSLSLPADWLRAAIGASLAIAAARMAWTGLVGKRGTGATREASVAVRLAVGGAIGFAAGVTGTGGGIFLSPLVLFCGWADPKRTAATASLFILVNSIAGLGGLAVSGWSPTGDLVPLMIAASLGGLVGSTLGSRRATPRALNLLLAVVLAVAAVKLIAGGVAAIAGPSSAVGEDRILPDRRVELHPLDERRNRRDSLGPVPRSDLAGERDLADRDPAPRVHRLDRADAVAG